MTPEEYTQLKAFARQDGALLSLLWIGGFACYIGGLTRPQLGMMALLLLAASPFFAASRLRHFRNHALEGVITFGRGYAYSILIFFYGGLLLAAATYIYFAFLDHGFLVQQFTAMLQSPEGQQLQQMYGLNGQIEEGLKVMGELRPIDYTLNTLSLTIMSGFLLGVPIALVMQRAVIRKINSKT